MTAQPIQDHRTEATIENVRNRISEIEDLNARGVGTALWHQQFELACLRMLLAGMRSEPFMYGIATPDGTAHFGEYCVCESPAYLEDEVDCLNSDRTEEGAPLYHVVALFRHPAPVAVPDCFRNAVSALESLYRNGQKQCWNERYTTDMAYASGVLNACRTAMLQPGTLINEGTKPVSPRYTLPDGWIKCSEQMPERDVDVQVYCSDKKEQMVGYLERNEGEGWFRFATWRNGDGIYCQPTHWKPLTSAPEQEV